MFLELVNPLLDFLGIPLYALIGLAIIVILLVKD